MIKGTKATMDYTELLKFKSPVVPVTVEGKKFFVTSMSGGARERIQELWGKGKSPLSYAVACCLCNEHGVKYDPVGAKHGELKKVDSVFLDKLFDESMKVSGLADEEPDPNPISGSGSN